MLDGVARRWNTWRLLIAEEAERRGIIGAWEKRGGRAELVPATTVTPLTEALAKERTATIDAALQKLTKPQQEIVDLVFGISQEPMGLEQAAQTLQIPLKEAKRQFEQALAALSNDKELQQLR